MAKAKKPAKKAKKAGDLDIAELSRSLSRSTKETIKRLQTRAKDTDRALAKQLKSLKNGEDTKQGIVRELTVSLAVQLDKQIVGLHALRELEATAGDSIEATMIVVEEAPDGTRRVVGVPPELAGVVPLG